MPLMPLFKIRTPRAVVRALVRALVRYPRPCPRPCPLSAVRCAWRATFCDSECDASPVFVMGLSGNCCSLCRAAQTERAPVPFALNAVIL